VDPIALPPEIVALRARLRAFIADELAPASVSEGIADEAQASPALRPSSAFTSSPTRPSWAAADSDP
jgi:hypothetical protein